MVICEQRFLETVPNRLKAIENALTAIRPRFVKVSEKSYINVLDIKEAYYDEDKDAVYLNTKDDSCFRTQFKSIEDALTAMGVEVVG